MKLSLPENIRSFRKQRKMTQEKLAEALGVTVGAVYKWESGLSQPELNLIVEMADFFDTSVDVLLGYKMKDNRMDAALDRLESYCRTMDPAALMEAGKLLGRYPNSFKVVYRCAKVYLGFGASQHDPELLRQSLDLMERARTLLPQNDDSQISDATLCGDLSVAWFLLGEKKKSLELLKKNNAGGVFNSQIGTFLAIYMDRPEEAAPYLSEALLDVLSTLLNTVISYVFIFRAREDWDSALAITSWGIDFLTGLIEEAKPGILEKTHAQMQAVLAYVQLKAGLSEESMRSLEKAGTLARHFDLMPDYSLTSMRFADSTDQSVFYSVFGTTASDSVTVLLSLLDDRPLSEQWKKVASNEQ